MIIKKFQAKTEDEAVTQAKKELGENVVVMNVRMVKPKGLFKWFKSPIVEVMVAKEEETEAAHAKEQTEKMQTENLKDVIASIDKLRQLGEGSKELSEKKTLPAEEAVLEERLENIQNLLEEKLKKQEDKTNEQEKEKAGEEKNNEMTEFIRLLYNTMIENEVHEKYANQMIDEVEQNFGENMQVEYVLSHIYQKMVLKFGKVEPITPAEKKGPKVIFFLGPTGVGKTTTLAKIASQFSVSGNKKIALFTADTYRISATDQLKTYANILGVPFHIIYSVDEMKSCLENYKEYDYVLIDTAGHSPNNVERRRDMNEFIHAFGGEVETEVYLVLSATTKYRDLVNITDTYTEITDYKMIFTKLDETTVLGNLLNLKIHTGAPLSYVTNGQNVPDDIELFQPQEAVRKILGGQVENR